MKPQRLAPSFREKVWGATRLEPWFPNSQQKIGEVWFEGAALPLLVKFLFTSENLSIQVHPNDSYARAHENSSGKTEMWQILAAEPGAKIAAGFRRELTKDQIRSAALSGEIVDLLEWFPAAPGDTFFIPAGTVHAIGAGLALCEIQQHSDVTYRLYDYGRPRQLHLERSLEVCDRGPYPARQQPSGDVLVSCEYFVTRRIRGSGAIQLEPKDAPRILIVIEGSGQIDGHPTTAGEVWHLPPESAPSALTGSLTLLETSTACE